MSDYNRRWGNGWSLGINITLGRTHTFKTLPISFAIRGTERSPCPALLHGVTVQMSDEQTMSPPQEENLQKQGNHCTESSAAKPRDCLDSLSFGDFTTGTFFYGYTFFPELTSPIEFTAASVNNCIILMTFLVAELLTSGLLPQERGDVPGTQSCSGPATTAPMTI